MVMELLGKNIEKLFREPNQTFSLKTVCMLAIKILDILEYIHSKYIIHRDIKPDNFVVGLEDKREIYIIDFGLAKFYRSPETLIHNTFTKNRKLTGTARYASINALQGMEQSRRDDLESLGYMLIYLVKGSLPWQGISVKNKAERYSKIAEKKKIISSNTLCSMLPENFEEFINYTKNLQFDQEPNYEYMKSLFLNIIAFAGEECNYYFDWIQDESTNLKTKESEEPIKISKIIYEQENHTINTIGIDYYKENKIQNKEKVPKKQKQKKFLSKSFCCAFI